MVIAIDNVVADTIGYSAISSHDGGFDASTPTVEGVFVKTLLIALILTKAFAFPSHLIRRRLVSVIATVPLPFLFISFNVVFDVVTDSTQ